MRGQHAGKVEWVGNPLRESFANVPSPQERFAARSGPLRLLVVGGSLGAKALNERVPAALALMAHDARPIVVHQAGEAHIDALRAAYAKDGVDAECVAFIDNMAQRYAEADLVICRGGAITVAELAVVGVAALIVPLPGAIADEQSANANYLVDAGAAVRIAQRELTPQRLAESLRKFGRHELLAMAINARRLGRADAADRVAEICVELCKPRSDEA
jgi:UDP-N-acetylglucosamine--N-acetylmuramyl-(pentapeptide) pyrophosphoryl-undecaprenol N-acetylglucosamine transferase